MLSRVGKGVNMGGILIVDDDRDHLSLLRCILEGEGVRAHYATSGEEAVQKLMGELPIAIMITDLHMPEMDGIELAMIAKEITPNITVVIMTGDTSPGVPQMAAAAGISKVFAKPLNLGQIMAMVRSKKYYFRQPVETISL
jgi:CheY-like chemotaxis protein